MKSYPKTVVTVVAVTLILGLQNLYACSTCGCSDGKAKAEPKPDEAACPSGACSVSEAPKVEAAHSHDIDTFQMKAHVDSGDAILLDARSGKYDDGNRIPGAKSLNSQSTAEEIAAVIPSKDALVVTYCSNLQCPASKALAEHLEALGYTNVQEYPEGIAGWRAAGGKVDKAK